MLDAVQQARDWLSRRAQAYRIMFTPDGVHSRRVLADLAKFCRANESTFHPDPRVEARLDGRREVWLRISQHLNLTDEQLFDLLNSNKQ
jgi:hypothetical protein